MSRLVGAGRTQHREFPSWHDGCTPRVGLLHLALSTLRDSMRTSIPATVLAATLWFSTGCGSNALPGRDAGGSGGFGTGGFYGDGGDIGTGGFATGGSWGSGGVGI